MKQDNHAAGTHGTEFRELNNQIHDLDPPRNRNVFSDWEIRITMPQWALKCVHGTTSSVLRP